MICGRTVWHFDRSILRRNALYHHVSSVDGMISAITIIDNFIFTVISMLRALPRCSHFMTTAKPYAGNLRRERLDHRRDVILLLRWGSCRAYIFPVVKTVPIDVSAHARI